MGTFVRQIRIKRDLASRFGATKLLDFKFEKHVNILCGPNGSGKSTLLACLFPGAPDIWSKAIAIPNRDKQVRISLGSDGRMVRKFDFEFDNPRNKSFGHSVMAGDIGLAGVIQSAAKMSHGQAMKRLIDGLLDAVSIKGACILLDEPEQALDFDGLLYLKDRLKTLRNQYVVATHAPVLILEPAFNVVELVAGYKRRVLDATADIVRRAVAAEQDTSTSSKRAKPPASKMQTLNVPSRRKMTK